MNDIEVIEDSIGEEVSLDLLEIDDDISPSEFITFETSRPFRPLEPIVLKLFKPLESTTLGFFMFLELENRFLKLVFEFFEELIKPIDFLNPTKYN